MGHVTVVHKGKEKDVQPQGEPDHQLITQLAAVLGHVTVVYTKMNRRLGNSLVAKLHGSCVGHVCIVRKVIHVERLCQSYIGRLLKY